MELDQLTWLDNLSPLQGLHQLQRLFLNPNRIVDSTPLATLKNLVELDVSGNQLTQLTAADRAR